MYRDKVAPPRRDVNSSPTSFIPQIGSAASNQELTQTSGSIDRTVAAGPSGKYNEGNQIQFQGNSKGTGRLGVPSAIALGSKDTSMAATENPDGEKNRPGSKVAPGVRK